jgi:RNase P subunit RPR2
MEAEMDQTPEDHWRELSEHILTDVKEWRRTHPKATFREIEEEIHARMSRLEAQLIEDTAQESQSREWSGARLEERPSCPVCKSPLQARGKRQRRLQAAGGHEVRLLRTYGTCPNCGTGLFPPR